MELDFHRGGCRRKYLDTRICMCIMDEFRKKYDIPDDVDDIEIEDFRDFLETIEKSTTNEPDDDFFDDSRK